MKETILTFELIKESDRYIKFDPPLKIEAYPSEKDENLFFVDFDFGLSIEMSVANFRMKGLPSNDNERIARLKSFVEFELFHSMHHLQKDPNYSVLNWALFGNLARRVECGEDWGDGITPDITSWRYNSKLQKVYNRPI